MHSYLYFKNVNNGSFCKSFIICFSDTFFLDVFCTFIPLSLGYEWHEHSLLEEIHQQQTGEDRDGVDHNAVGSWSCLYLILFRYSLGFTATLSRQYEQDDSAQSVVVHLVVGVVVSGGLCPTRLYRGVKNSSDTVRIRGCTWVVG